jgi:uncharacterized peroxidase-related enzyme
VSFIETIPEGRASGAVAEMYEEDLADDGYIHNYTRAFSHRPALSAAWANLNKTVKSPMDLRRYEIATMGAAIALQSSYCSLAHGERLLGLGLDEDDVRAMAGPEPTGLSEQERLVFEFAAKIARSATSVTQEDIDRLRAAGLADDEVFDVAAAASARCFFSKLLDATGTRPDSVFRRMIPGLVADLTVGRPIDDYVE